GAEVVFVYQVVVAGRGGRADRRDRLGPRTEEVGGEDIAQGGLVDRLDGHLGEQAVAPGDEVVEVLHHDVVLEGDGSRPGHRERLEGCGQARGVAGEDILDLAGR